jgi:hypothetical protein
MERQREEEQSTLSKMIKMGLAGTTGNIVTQHIAAPFIDESIPSVGRKNVTDEIDNIDGAELHSGPAEGGAMLDRPIAGYLAEQTVGNSLSLEYTPDTISTIASNVDEASTMTVNGETIKVLDYAPGGDLIQASGGTQLDASSALGMVGQLAITTGSLQGALGTEEIAGQSQGFSSGLELSEDGNDNGDRDSESKEINKPGSPLRDQLEAEHRLALQTALQTSDETEIETEVHSGGKSLKVKTSFEARMADSSQEQKEGEKHIQDIIHQPRNDIQKTHDYFRMRSVIESNDEGMSISY